MRNNRMEAKTKVVDTNSIDYDVVQKPNQKKVYWSLIMQ